MKARIQENLTSLLDGGITFLDYLNFFLDEFNNIHCNLLASIPYSIIESQFTGVLIGK